MITKTIISLYHYHNLVKLVLAKTEHIKKKKKANNSIKPQQTKRKYVVLISH